MIYHPDKTQKSNAVMSFPAVTVDVSAVLDVINAVFIKGEKWRWVTSGAIASHCAVSTVSWFPMMS